MRIFLILFLGGCLGWLIGLSESPVLSTLIAGVVTLVCSILVVISGLSMTSNDAQPSKIPFSYINKIRVGPIFALVLGVSIAATSGVYVRANGYLGKSLDDTIEKWVALGIDRELALQRVFDHYYPVEGPNNELSKAERGVLFSVSADDCQRILSVSTDRIRFELRSMHDRNVSMFAEEVDDPDVLSVAAKYLICGKK